MRSQRLMGSGIIVCFVLVVSLPAQQNDSNRPQTRPPPPGQAGRPAPPQRPSGGNRPNPSGGSNGRPQIQPPRPSTPGDGRPQIQPPRPGGGRPPSPPNRPSRPGRPPQWGRPPQNRPSYNFRRNDRDLLRRHYLNHLRYINRARRPHFSIGGFFPYGDIGYLSTLPTQLYGTLPPPPPGYAMGYFDGYVVVYDPVSYFIANLVDLLQ